MDETIWDRDARAAAAAVIMGTEPWPGRKFWESDVVAKYAAHVATELQKQRVLREQELTERALRPTDPPP